MINIIVGTAGHIDHGKSALVRALTGIEPDRLAEERERGITIDLGFAHLDLGGGVRAGFVDVPGHERFVRNMLAGAGGVDIVLLVVAADEGVKPQTREHFEICRLLGISKAVVALTKADLADSAMLEIVEMEVADLLAGSQFEAAPRMAVSSVTGQGLDGLKAALRIASGEAKKRAAQGAFRLPVDRAFSIRGFGTVATGTMLTGRLTLETQAALYPGNRAVRIRGLQVHGDSVAEAVAGQRTAVNLAGVEASEIKRGMAIAPQGLFECATTIDCRLELLKTAYPLKHRAPVHFHLGTAAVEAEARLLKDISKPVEPGATDWVRFVLKEPVLVLPGDRFIVRMFSPVVTIGGGVVVDIAPPPRWKRAAIMERLPALAAAGLAGQVRLYAAEVPHGARAAALAARCGVTVEEILAQREAAGCRLVRDPEPRLIPEESFRNHANALSAQLAKWHREEPLKAGLPKRSVQMEPWLLESILAEGRGQFVADNELVRLASHRVALAGAEEQAAARIESLFMKAGLAVPAVAEALAGSGIDGARARSLMELLIRGGTLVRVSPELVYHRVALQGLMELLAAKKGLSFSVGDFKDWTGVSRKYAIPLLEYLDRARVTRRLADKRTVL